MAQIPNEYDPDRELERLYAEITGRAPFRYTPSADPLYRSYAEQSIQNGRLAMRDTVGRSAALTGGYASSYAQSAGQQQYGEYLRRLGEAMPEFYERAFRRYQAQQDALRDDYALARERRDTAYQRERDSLADARYEQERQAEAESEARKLRESEYNRIVKLISSAGYSPTDAELEASGLTREQAEALRTEYLRAHKLLGGGTTTVVYRSGGSEKKSAAKKAAALPDIVSRIVKPVARATGGVR